MIVYHQPSRQQIDTAQTNVNWSSDSNINLILAPPRPHGSSYFTTRADRHRPNKRHNCQLTNTNSIGNNLTQQVRRTITASDISRTRSTKLDQNKKYNRREGWPDLHWNPTTTFALPLRNNNPLSAYYTMIEVKEAGCMWISRRIWTRLSVKESSPWQSPNQQNMLLIIGITNYS